MFDLFSRAFLHPFDYLGVMRSHDLTLIETTQLGDNIYTFIFSLPTGITYKPGQHAIFTLPDKKIAGKTWRPFSVASSFHEGVIRIATVIPDTPSDFKTKLRSMLPGDKIRMHGPFGEFHAHAASSHIVGVAGGIGITPFRAIAYEIAHGHLPGVSMTLIYSARDVFAFKDELDSWQNENLSIIYTHTPEEVNAELNTQWQQHGNNVEYYLSGSPGMINALRTTCKNMGITRITNDPFKGY